MADAAPIDLRQRLDQLIQWQDEIVRELRSTIFALQTDHQWATSAAQEFTRVVDQSAPSLGFRPTLRLHGTLELIDCAHHLGHLVFVLREMLSNVARHARATRVAVTIRVDAGRIELRVDDDGCGTNSTTRPGNGIANLTRRARMLGGTCRIGPARCGGTSVQWSIPVTT
jgi:signal transduction histidine kinase